MPRYMAEVQGPVGIVVKHILKHPKTGRLSFRRAYPPELRPFIPHGAGKKAPQEHKVSLGAADVNAPGVLARYEKAASDYEAAIALARRKRDGAFDRLDAPRIAYLAEAFRIEQLEGDDQARWSQDERELYRSVSADLKAQGVALQTPWEGTGGRRWALKRREALERTLPRYREMKADGDLEAIVDTWRDEGEELIAANGLVVDPNAHADFALFCRALNDAAVRAGEDMVRRLAGEDVPTPPAIAAPAVPVVLPSPLRGCQSWQPSMPTPTLRASRPA